MGVWACGHVEADNCKKKKKKLTGLGVWTCYGWACMRLRADVDGCKQINKKKGERKKKWNGLTTGGGHEHAVRTLFEHCVRTLPNKDKLFEQCSNTWK